MFTDKLLIGTKSVRGKQDNGLCTRCSTEFPSSM